MHFLLRFPLLQSTSNSLVRCFCLIFSTSKGAFQPARAKYAFNLKEPVLFKFPPSTLAATMSTCMLPVDLSPGLCLGMCRALLAIWH